ncbi:MAG: DNA translocase FtsK [Verrucomicrobia bacterium]|nr:DNA translocase FtsK [Verrucomicrobiota bacterium]
MARKDAPEQQSPKRRTGESIGVILAILAVLLFFAIYSYDKADIAFNNTKVNQPERNLVGSAGAHVAFGTFFAMGAAAYLLPLVLLAFAWTCFSDSFMFLRRKWAWSLVLLFSFACLLDLYTDRAIVSLLAKEPRLGDAGFFERLSHNINAPSSGGIVGLVLNDAIFRRCGAVGATIIFCSLYFASLLFLTDFQVVDWFRDWRARKAAEANELGLMDSLRDRRLAELKLERQKLERELERQRRAEAEAHANTSVGLASAPFGEEKPALGADLQPVPEPEVRDLSVPVPRPDEPAPKPEPGNADKPAAEKSPRAKSRKSADVTAETPAAPPKSTEPVQPAAVPASEVKPPATVAEILGLKPDGAAPKPAAGISPALPASAEPIALAAATPAAAEESAPAAPVPAKIRQSPASRKPRPMTVASTPQITGYQLPSLDLLNLPDTAIKPTESREELMANARLMQQTLAQFGIEVALGDITKGPTITRYELHPSPGVKLEKITALSNNIAAALKAERIHILAPVPGKSSVGIEVPNAIKTKVIMRDLLEAEDWNHSKARVPLALGKDVYGHPIIADLSDMPHLLIAGSTGSGKSVCINSIVASLLYKFPPNELRFVMIDPKVVELQQYNALPHLVVPVVTDPKKVILALRWVVSEMEKRYQIFARVGVRNIKSFNDRPKNKPLPPREPELPLMAKKEKIEPGSDGFAVEVDEDIVVPEDEDIVIPDKLSYIVVIIDELADLMLVAPAEVEMAIARITQMARAAGIHCIVATQRPSVDVITGVIKANIPARIAFQVASRVDSRTILDAMGADKLLGKGDMLYLPPGSAKLIRAQGALVTDKEIESIVQFISRQGKPSYEMEIHQQLSQPAGFGAEEGGCGEPEEVIQQCIEVIRSEQKASVSLLQRRLRLGYGRAARIMDELEGRGIVGPSKGAEPRDILIDLDGEGHDGNGQQAV